MRTLQPTGHADGSEAFSSSVGICGDVDTRAIEVEERPDAAPHHDVVAGDGGCGAIAGDEEGEEDDGSQEEDTDLD
jgi:hypothetical protein